MSADVDVNVRIDSRGPIRYHGHFFLYGRMAGNWQMKCIDCGEEVDGSVDDLPPSELHMPIFWLYVVSSFDKECDGDSETYKDALMGRIEMDDYLGMLKDTSTKMEIQRDIQNSISVGQVKASVDFK